MQAGSELGRPRRLGHWKPSCVRTFGWRLKLSNGVPLMLPRVSYAAVCDSYDVIRSFITSCSCLASTIGCNEREDEVARYVVPGLVWIVDVRSEVPRVDYI